MVLSRPNIRYIPPYLPYLLNYLLIWVKTVTYFYEPYSLILQLAAYQQRYRPKLKVVRRPTAT
jgi:hypothetical protein